MSWYDNLEIDESSQSPPEGTDNYTWSQVRKFEWWETFGPDGRRYATGPTREAAILSHRDSHLFLVGQYHKIAAERRRRGMDVDEDFKKHIEDMTPICGVRRVVRWETNSGWQESDSSELLDHDSIIKREAVV